MAGASTGALDGLVEMTPVEKGLPEAIERAEAARTSLTLLLFRPRTSSDSISASSAPSSSDPLALTDLAAALAASIEDGQSLFEAGRGYLAVVMQGGSRIAARSLARRAVACGAPSFACVASRYPRDARSARGLAQAAARRMRADLQGSTTRRTKALWAVTASLLAVGALVYFVRPPSAPQSSGGRFAVQANRAGTSGAGGSGAARSATGNAGSSSFTGGGYGSGAGTLSDGGASQSGSSSSNGSGATSSSGTDGVGSIIASLSGGSVSATGSSGGPAQGSAASGGGTSNGSGSGSGSSVGIGSGTEPSGGSGILGSVGSGGSVSSAGAGTTTTGTTLTIGTGSGSGSGSRSGSGSGSGSSPTTTPTTSPHTTTTTTSPPPTTTTTTTTTSPPPTCLPPLVLVGTVCVPSL